MTWQLAYKDKDKDKEESNRIVRSGYFPTKEEAVEYMRRWWSSAERYEYALLKDDKIWHGFFDKEKFLETIEQHLVWTDINHPGETKMAAAKNAFEYIVLLHAEPQRDAQGNDVTKDSEILIGPEKVVATDVEHVKRIAARKIPTTVTDSALARVEVKVKGF